MQKINHLVNMAREEGEVAKYRKKPVIREAEQWFPGKSVPGVWGDKSGELCPCYVVGGNHSRPHVMTAHNQLVHIEPGDYIIKEPAGDGYYPCKPDIFEKEYELVEVKTHER
jgi:hypothetical protein